MQPIPAHFVDGIDPSNGMPVIGISVNDTFVFDTFKSECGRFLVDPTVAYGLDKQEALWITYLNSAIEKAADDALNAGCLAVQNTLSVTDGGFAGVYFSDDAVRNSMATVFRAYLRAEQAHGYVEPEEVESESAEQG